MDCHNCHCTAITVSAGFAMVAKTIRLQETTRFAVDLDAGMPSPDPATIDEKIQVCHFGTTHHDPFKKSSCDLTAGRFADASILSNFSAL